MPRYANDRSPRGSRSRSLSRGPRSSLPHRDTRFPSPDDDRRSAAYDRGAGAGADSAPRYRDDRSYSPDDRHRTRDRNFSRGRDDKFPSATAQNDSTKAWLIAPFLPVAPSLGPVCIFWTDPVLPL